VGGCRCQGRCARRSGGRGRYKTWFNANVKPNVPGEIQQEVIDLDGVLQP
jgi:hypothetical protein